MKSSYAEDLQRAISVMTAIIEKYDSTDKPDVELAEYITNEIVEEPDGVSHLISGFANLTITLLNSIEQDQNIPKHDMLQIVAAAVALLDEGG